MKGLGYKPVCHYFHSWYATEEFAIDPVPQAVLRQSVIQGGNNAPGNIFLRCWAHVLTLHVRVTLLQAAT
jgi:hypothetical protein